MTVLVGGTPRQEYVHHGTTYIEALRGRDFKIQLRNPSGYRVAVALSVDGLNTIDARRTDSWSAAKWVLEPYETTEIAGWQVNDRTARRFYFTGERNSYGAALVPASVGLARRPFRTSLDNLWMVNATAGFPSVAGTIGAGMRLYRELADET